MAKRKKVKKPQAKKAASKKAPVTFKMIGVKVTRAEHAAVQKKADLCTAGNMSDLVRKAVMAFKPSKNDEFA